jgi:putative hemolysin
VNPWVALAGALGLLFLSAVFSGAETGLYSVSRVRLEAEAQAGRRAARLLSLLLRQDAILLVTLLIGNNLMLELLTHMMQASVGRSGLPSYTHELVAAAILTPVVFLFGELVPKDLFRRRPHLAMALVAPFLSIFRWLALPLAWPLALLSRGLERLLGLGRGDSTRILRREEMVELLAEGRRTGALTLQTEELAHNALVLRHTPLARVAIPWERVESIDLDQSAAGARAAVEGSGFTRIPALRSGEDGKRAVVGYLHQLDVLGQGAEVPLEESLRSILELPEGLSLDQAVAELQAAGQRLAIVGTLRAPSGLVSLMDLLAALASQTRFAQPGAPARIGGSR